KWSQPPMPLPPHYRELSPDLCQGDIFREVPHVHIKGPVESWPPAGGHPSRAPPRRAPGGRSGPGAGAQPAGLAGRRLGAGRRGPPAVIACAAATPPPADGLFEVAGVAAEAGRGVAPPLVAPKKHPATEPGPPGPHTPAGAAADQVAGDHAVAEGDGSAVRA